MNTDLKLKVCGMKEPSNIRDVASLRPDLMGFIFHHSSPRDASGIDPAIIKEIPDGITPVAVTVNATEESLLHLADTYGFTTFQLHGSEPPELCRRLRRRGFSILKAISVKDKDSLSNLEIYAGNVDAFIFDTATATHGGSGKKFNWNLLSSYNLPVGFFLSGGIAPQDAAAIGSIAHPFLMGVDVNSRFEISPAIKSVSALSSFINQLFPHKAHQL